MTEISTAVASHRTFFSQLCQAIRAALKSGNFNIENYIRNTEIFTSECVNGFKKNPNLNSEIESG